MKGSMMDTVVMVLVGVIVVMGIALMIKTYLISFLTYEIQQSADYNTRKIVGYLNGLVPGIPTEFFYNLPGGECNLTITNNTVRYERKTGKRIELSVRGRIYNRIDVESFTVSCGPEPKIIKGVFNGHKVIFENEG